MYFGQNIKILRTQRQLSQKELADKVGVTQTYLSLVENNVKKPSLTLLEKISIALETPLALIFSELAFTAK